jgi:hypothetical protein
MRRAAAVVVTGALCALAAACGGGSPERVSSGPRPAALPASAVPYLESSERPLTAAGMAKETGLPELAGRLREWGYDAGSRRYFQGPSKRLQVVDSRTLRFRSAAGAQAFVAFVRSRPAAFLGGGLPARDFASRGRRGILVVGAACSCHLATPVLLGVVAGGPVVTWLEINGPGASRRALGRLAARAT